MQSSQSNPGQLAAAIKRADPRSQAPSLPAEITHGHEDQAPEAAVWPAHLLGPLTGKDASGGETADRPS